MRIQCKEIKLAIEAVEKIGEEIDGFVFFCKHEKDGGLVINGMSKKEVKMAAKELVAAVSAERTERHEEDESEGDVTHLDGAMALARLSNALDGCNQKEAFKAVSDFCDMMEKKKNETK